MKQMNRAKFFLAIRNDPVLFGGAIQQSAVDNINLIVDEFERRTSMLLTMLAAILATTLGEVGRAFLPVREGFKKTDAESQAYVKRNFPHYAQTYMIVAGKAVAAAVGLMFYGRGYVQLTWLRNYEAFRAEILSKFGVDIVANPDLVLRPDIAIYIMFEGMLRGIFTGKKLANYFTATVTNWNFRPIINGTDKMALHNNYAQRFHAAAKASLEDAAVPPKEVVNNVTSRERNAVKVGTGGAVATGVADQGAFDWTTTLIGAGMLLVVVVAVFLIYRKRKNFLEAWSKL